MRSIAATKASGFWTVELHDGDDVAFTDTKSSHSLVHWAPCPSSWRPRGYSRPTTLIHGKHGMNVEKRVISCATTMLVRTRMDASFFFKTYPHRDPRMFVLGVCVRGELGSFHERR